MEIQDKEILELSDINSYDKYCKYVSNEEMIGQGANGIVMKAYVNQIQVIAVKKIQLNFRSYLEENEILEKENNFLMTLDHPNIIKTYFHFMHYIPKKPCFYYIGMEYLTQDLESYLEKRKSNQLSEDEVAQLAYQMQKGLSYLEEKKTCHRDLKPANILINNDGVLKLCDFSEIKYDLITLKSITTILAGTPSYLAPELKNAQLKKNNKLNYNLIKADVFSFGLILLKSLLNCPDVSIGFLNESEQATNELIENNFSQEFQWFLKYCLSFNTDQRITFLQMNEIFKLNPIKAYYAKIGVQNKIKQLEKEYQNIIEENKRITKENEELKKLNQQLQKDNNALQEQLNQNRQQPSPSKIIPKNKIILKTDEQLKQIFISNIKIWKQLSQEQRQNSVLKNSQLKWDDYYYDLNDDVMNYYLLNGINLNNKYGSNYYSNDDGTQSRSFILKDIPAAVNLTKKLSDETGYSVTQCLKILHSNLWDYKKSFKDMTWI